MRRAGPIFVVHGHAHDALHEVVRVLERATDRELIVLHEQPNEVGRLLRSSSTMPRVPLTRSSCTADDEGGAAASDARRPRGRQNVVFELGFFFGRLGRDRVAVLAGQDVERPSDIDGLVYIALDASGMWKHALARELGSVGIEVDHARIPG